MTTENHPGSRAPVCMAEHQGDLKSEIWREVRRFTRVTLITFFVLGDVVKVHALTGFTVCVIIC